MRKKGSGGGFVALVVFIILLVGGGINLIKEYAPYFVAGAVGFTLLLIFLVRRSANKTYLFIGNTATKVYHRPGCRTLGNINKRNLIGFTSEAQAIRKGYSKCTICKGE